jgi:PleD family two-component response regulator
MNRTVLALVDDLFWRTKIDHAVKSASSPIVFISDPSELAAAADPQSVGILLVDLSLRKEPFTAISSLKKSAKTKSIPVIGYYEHVRKDLQQKGNDAGCDEVLARSAFSEKLGDLVLKYVLPGSTRTVEEEPELPEE